MQRQGQPGEQSLPFIKVVLERCRRLGYTQKQLYPLHYALASIVRFR